MTNELIKHSAKSNITEQSIRYRIYAVVDVPVESGEGIQDLLETIRGTGSACIVNVCLANTEMPDAKADFDSFTGRSEPQLERVRKPKTAPPAPITATVVGVDTRPGLVMGEDKHSRRSRQSRKDKPLEGTTSTTLNPEKLTGLASFEIRVPAPDHDWYRANMDTVAQTGSTAIEAVQSLFNFLGLDSTVKGIQDYAKGKPNSQGKTNLLAILDGTGGK